MDHHRQFVLHRNGRDSRGDLDGAGQTVAGSPQAQRGRSARRRPTNAHIAAHESADRSNDTAKVVAGPFRFARLRQVLRLDRGLDGARKERLQGF